MYLLLFLVAGPFDRGNKDLNLGSAANCFANFFVNWSLRDLRSRSDNLVSLCSELRGVHPQITLVAWLWIRSSCAMFPPVRPLDQAGDAISIPCRTKSLYISTRVSGLAPRIFILQPAKEPHFLIS